MVAKFGILGSLHVTVSGSFVQVGAAKSRKLLATLLLRANETVSAEELADRLWDEDPPRSAKGAIQTYVMRLRAALGDAGHLIETRPSGYAIAVTADSLDLAMYRRHRERARTAAAAGDLAAEAEELRTALALWRGQPLSDVDSEWLQRHEVPPLVEDRLQALERRIDVDLCLGRHADVVGELRGLTVAHPFREGIWNRLILALYRSNCQAEALEAYQRLRSSLREELGVEPCNELQSLNRQILRRDPQLAAPTSAAEADGRSRTPVFQLPADLPDFVGREKLLEQITAALAPSSGRSATVPIVILSGPPGVGKTALAIHAGYLLQKVYPDGNLYLDMRGFSGASTVTAGEALVRLLRSLDASPSEVPADTDEQATLLRSVLSGRRVLLVLDNAANAQQIRPLIPGAAGSAVIVTSRDSLHGLVAANGARVLPVGPVTPADAMSLLASVLGERIHNEPAAAELAALCGYLPLALRIAAANIAIVPARPVAAYTERLRAESRVPALSIDGDDFGVERAFELSYEVLSPSLARLFRLLSIVPGADFDRYAAASLVDVDVPTAQVMLDRLVTVNLLDSHAPERYRFHDLIRSYARLLLGRIDGPNERRAAYHRLFSYYVHAANSARNILYPELPQVRPPEEPAELTVRPWPDHSTARRWFDAEAVNLEALVRSDQQGDAPVWILADALLVHFDRSDRDWLEVFSVARAAADRHADGRGRAAVFHGLGTLHFRRCELTEARAYYQRAADASRDAGDPAGECRATNGLACVANDMQSYPEAIELYERALALLGPTMNETGQLGILLNLGITMVLLGRDQEALQYLESANAIAQERTLPHVRPQVVSGVAMSAHWRGHLDSAAQGFRDALEIWRDLRVESGQAKSLRNLAEVHLDAGDLEQAVSLAGECLELSEKIGDPWVSTGAAATLGHAALARGQGDLALELFHRAESMLSFRLPYWRSFIALGFAACARLTGDNDRAVELATGVIADARPRYRGPGHLERARALLALDVDAAIVDVDAAIEISRSHDYVLAEADALDVRGQISRQLGDNHQAEEYAMRSRRLRESAQRLE